MVGKGDVVVKVWLGDFFVGGDSIIQALCNFEGLFGPVIKVGVFVDIWIFWTIFVHSEYIAKVICQSLVHIDLEFVPGLLSEGSSDIVSLLVKNLIPQAVQALNAISVRQFESIATLVSSWQLWRETAHAVQWLHYITQEMNQHAKGVWLCSIFVIWVLSHSQVLVDVAFFVRLTLFAT